MKHGRVLVVDDNKNVLSALKILLPKLKVLNLNVWLYSGDIYENLIKKKSFQDIVEYIDVLVDGPFVKSKLDLNLKFRGSTNQRLIDIRETLENKKIILYSLTKKAIS